MSLTAPSYPPEERGKLFSSWRPRRAGGRLPRLERRACCQDQAQLETSGDSGERFAHPASLNPPSAASVTCGPAGREGPPVAHPGGRMPLHLTRTAQLCSSAWDPPPKLCWNSGFAPKVLIPTSPLPVSSAVCLCCNVSSKHPVNFGTLDAQPVFLLTSLPVRSQQTSALDAWSDGRSDARPLTASAQFPPLKQFYQWPFHGAACLCPKQGLYTPTAGNRLVSSPRLASYQFTLDRVSFFFFLTTPFLVSSGQDVFFFLFLRREK